MNRWLLILILLLATVVGAAAESRSLHVEWGYTPPTEPEVTGFQLYQEGEAVCIFPGGETTAGDCTVDLVAQVTNFTLTAMFSDDTESPHSAPFAFNPDEHEKVYFKGCRFRPENRQVPMNKPSGVQLQ